eukprot:1161175-Alexandrium_andersonii.AAC.1
MLPQTERFYCRHRIAHGAAQVSERLHEPWALLQASCDGVCVVEHGDVARAMVRSYAAALGDHCV